MCLLERRLKKLRVDARQDLPFFDRRVEIDVDFLKASETWAPTCTVTSADSVPLAVTLATMRSALDRAGLELRARLFLSGEQGDNRRPRARAPRPPRPASTRLAADRPAS